MNPKHKPKRVRIQVRVRRSAVDSLQATLARHGTSSTSVREDNSFACCQSRQDVATHALRVINYCLARGAELRRGVESVPLKLLIKRAAANESMDLQLESRDLERLNRLGEFLEDQKLSRSATIRACIDTYASLVQKLLDGFQLFVVEHNREYTVSAWAIAECRHEEIRKDSRPREEPDLNISVLSGKRVDSSNPSSKDEEEATGVPRADAESLDRLPSTLFFVTTFNRWLCTKIADITQAAQGDSPLEWIMANGDPQDRYVLERLLCEFLNEVQEHDLRAIFLDHPLLPKKWQRENSHRVLALAEIGKHAVESFLRARRASLRPWPLTTKGLPEGTCAEQGADRPPFLWRNWTRSRDCDDGYREVSPPLEWVAVLQHKLLLDHGGDATMAAHHLQACIVDTFGIRLGRHLEALAKTCDEFNREFYGDPRLSSMHPLQVSDHLISLRDMLSILERALRNEDVQATSSEWKADWASCFYLILVTTRTVRPVYRWRVPMPRSDEIELCVRSIARAEFSELRSHVFGAQTAIDGLHWIFHGGIVPRANMGRTWMIHGSPGSGKSTFALHLAADAARRGRVAILVCTEEQSQAVEDRLRMFGLRDEERFDLVDRDTFEEMLDNGGLREHEKGSGKPLKGLLVLFGASRQGAGSMRRKLSLIPWLESTSNRARDLSTLPPGSRSSHELRCLQKRWRWVAVVLDSVDALEVESPGLIKPEDAPESERRTLNRLVTAIEVGRFWGILLLGSNRGRTEAMSYLCDTAIELRTADAPLHRTLQVHKCRTQPFDPGPHIFQIIEGVGCVVHPNLASVQRAVRRRMRPLLDSEHVIPVPDHIHWPADESLTSDDSGKLDAQLRSRIAQDSQSRLPRIRSGSTVLLHGPPQSGKTPFLLNFMSERMRVARFPEWVLGASGAALLVSFRGREQDVFRPLRESTELGARWTRNVSDIRTHWYGADETLQAPQIVHELMRRIRRSRRDRMPLEWIGFLGIEALDGNLPAVAQEKTFWPTILGITSSEGISTVFVVNDMQPGEASNAGLGFVARHGQDMDYVLRFGNQGSRRIVEMEKSPDPLSKNEARKFSFERWGGTVRAEEE